MTPADILNARHKSHGAFADVADAAQAHRQIFRSMPGWAVMSFQHREALDSLAVKLARICCGDANEPDHWRDVQGYGLLGERACIKGDES